MTRIDHWTIAFAVVVILFLVLVLPAQAAKPEAFSGRAEVTQRLPRGWRYARPLQSKTVRCCISLPNRGR